MAYKDPNSPNAIATRKKYYELHKEEIRRKARKYQKEYQQKKRDAGLTQKYDREHYHKNKKTHENSRLKYVYGITLEEYNKLFNGQNGCCDICGRHQSEFKRKLDVDHNHKTGKIRGLLCSDCNFILGHSKECIVILEKAINYLRRF